MLLFTIAVSNSFAQTINLDEVPGCLVTDVTRKVTYTEPGNPTPKPVTAGMVLADDAVVSIGKKSSITLVKDDQSLVVAFINMRLREGPDNDLLELGDEEDMDDRLKPGTASSSSLRSDVSPRFAYTFVSPSCAVTTNGWCDLPHKALSGFS